MSTSSHALDALNLVSDLQSRFVAGLERISVENDQAVNFEKVEWLRDAGIHGGGHRFGASETCGLFNRGSVNVSHIHYQDLPQKRLSSATAISTIIHPRNPHAPSVHIHISWTEMKDGAGYWRIMGDLNPSISHDAYRDDFTEVMRKAAPQQFAEAAEQGDRYFFIPALNRHRGTTHFYLESYRSEDIDADRALAETFGNSVIDSYLDILARASKEHTDFDAAARREQIAYHTLYLFQVLTLDRGTTSGLLVHDQNDIGIMGSLPSHVDRDLLASWETKVPPAQQALVRALVDAIPEAGLAAITEEVKSTLAASIRNYYRRHPEALALQAKGNVIPPTVDNHS